MSRLHIDCWGPAAWAFLHAVAFSYPQQPTPQDRADMYGYIVAFAAVLPCKRCKDHFAGMVDRDLPNASSPALGSRRALAALTVAWHNQVNARLGKPVVPFDRVEKEHYPPRARRGARTAMVGAAAAGVLAVAAAHALIGRHRTASPYSSSRANLAR